MPNPTRNLINDTGIEFNETELEVLRAEFDTLTNQERTNYRNGNALAIANHASDKILIVSGPGTGKSTIFKKRISYWLRHNQSASILAISFVRKLVADLDNEIQGDPDLTDQEKQQVSVYTLHKYARSIVEKNNGTSQLRFQDYIRIVSSPWDKVVWEDVLVMSGQSNRSVFSLKDFNCQIHNLTFNTSSDWQLIREAYFNISKFYNAAGFADLILHAKKAVEENPSLVSHQFFIVDEFQDFNLAEEDFIKILTGTCSGVLIVGDDDQVLYEFKSGKPELIRKLYSDRNFTNAMLPFCGRSESFHITKAAEHFIRQSQDAGCIKKIYLPLKIEQNHPKVEVVVCASPSGAVDYIKKFTEVYENELEIRKNDLENGTGKKDPFLLIITPDKNVKFYTSRGVNKPDKELLELVSRYSIKPKKLSEDYYKVLIYYSLAGRPTDNFTFRKVLHFENVSIANVNTLIKKCLSENKKFPELEDQTVLSVLEKCQRIHNILNSADSTTDKVQQLSTELRIENPDLLKTELDSQMINIEQMERLKHQEEESAELEELEVKQMSAVELLSFNGSKGLSADHVIIIGFDNVNMPWVTKNAFYVALTRARKTLRIITALRARACQSSHDFLNSLPDEHINFYKYTKGSRRKVMLKNRQAFIESLGNMTSYRSLT